MGYQYWSYETLNKLCMDAFTNPKSGFTQEQPASSPTCC